MPKKMTEKDNMNWARDTAVEIHDKTADWFAQQYTQSQNEYSSPFMYGRKQIDIHFNSITADLPKGARILDVGCGTGDQVARLLELGFEARGIEPSEKMREHARARLQEGTVIDGSVLEMPFEDDYFDFVYAIEVFRYLDTGDNLEGLKEARRVLKPGGCFFGTFVNLYALDLFAALVGLRRLNARISGKPLDCHTEFETPGSLRGMFASAGFSGVEIHGAMIAGLRIAYKIAGPLGGICARLLDPLDRFISDTSFMRALAGHLIGIARK